MPKQVLQITNFAGGLNAYSDARDIEDNQFVQNWNAVVDKNGIIRVSGMAEDSTITTEYFDNTNFQKGYSLFQFTADYSLSGVDGNFSIGIKTGTLSAYASGTPSVTLETTVAAQASDYYKDWIIYIYSGPGKGESRKITASSTASPPVLTISAATTATLTSASKYIIYRWTPSANFLGDGSNNYDYIIDEGGETEYSLVSKSGNVTSNTSNDLGYVEYEPKLTLTPGIQYTASFECRTLAKYYNDVSDGSEDGSGTTYGDKVPWVELYSTTVVDTMGSIKTLSDYTPTSGEGNLVGGNWDENTHLRLNHTGEDTSGVGIGALFNVFIDGSSNHVVRLIPGSTGHGYAALDTITLTEPGGSKTIILTVASINVTGLSLLSARGENASYDWVRGIKGDGTTSGYITNPDSNHIDNGDFRAGASDQWDFVAHDNGSVHGLTAALGSATTSYDGVNNISLKLTTNLRQLGGGDGSGWFSQTLTLQELTSYALNFKYSALAPNGRGEVRVRDANDNQILWQNLQVTQGNFQNVPNYKWANEVVSSGVLGDYTYIQFKTPASETLTAGTVSVKIQFRPAVGNINDNRFYLHGVTLHKNHFDLSNMSFQNPEANNPFIDDVVGYSKYSFNFTIPDNYNAATDWIFRIHGGKYGWRASNDLDNGSANSQSQEVYIKNIEISGAFLSSSENKDTITLLSENSSEKSYISAYSSSSSFWTKNFLNFSGTKIKPVYNYINGMLKVSDSNFLNSNNNKLVYYSKRVFPGQNIYPKWVKRDNILPVPPSFTVSQNDADNFSSAVFDCNKYFNSIFSGLKYRENGATENSSYLPNAITDTTNWPMDSFGPISHDTENLSGVINPTGIVTRHFISSTAKAMRNGRRWLTGYPDEGYKTDSEISESYQQLYVPKETLNTWYHDNFLGGMTNQELDNEYYPGATGQYSIEGKDIVCDRYGIVPSSSGSNALLAHGDKNLVIESSAFNDTTADYWASSPIPDNPIGNIRYVDIKFRWELVGVTGRWQFYDFAILPAFKFQVGRIDNIELSGNLDLLEGQVAGNDFNFSSDTIQAGDYINSLIGDNIINQSLYGGAESSLYEICDGASGTNCRGNLEKYDSQNKLVGADFNRGTLDANDEEIWHGILSKGTNMQVILKMEDRITFDVFDDLQLDSGNDTILIKLIEDFNHAGVHPYEAPHESSVPLSTALLCLPHFVEDGTYGGWDHNLIFNTEATGFSGTTTQFLTGGTNSMTHVKGHHSSMYTRYVIEDFKIGFYNSEVDPTIELQGKKVGMNFAWGDTDSEGVGWADRIFQVATTAVNVFGEEAALSAPSISLGEDFDGSSFIRPGQAPSVTLKMTQSYLNDVFITKTKIYMRDTESEIWYLQCYIDHKKRTFHSSTSFESSNAGAVNSLGEIEWFLSRDNFKNFNEVSSYESETMVSQDDGVSNNKLTARYKTSVVANNRIYVGNVMQDGVIYGDRMLKSPIGKYNILPASSFVDVAINDGDEITALEYYKDKILQFKKRKIFVINISGDYEFLEDTFDNVGVLGQFSVTKTPHGIVWANKTGCYLYNGSQMTNLIDNRIPATSDYANTVVSIHNYWLGSKFDGDCVVGYIQDRDTLLIKWTSDSNTTSGFPDAASYHFSTKSWIFNYNSISGNSGASMTGAISNMITNVDGDLLYYRFRSDTQTYNGLKKWNNASLVTGTLKVYSFTTKDFTLGDIINRKKIYKVYVTYKTTDTDNSKVLVKAGTNGGSIAVAFSASASKFAGTTSTACYSASNGLLDTGGDWKIAELRFTTSSTFNNIYSFQLQFSGTGLTDSGFEINDISIVFRTKSTK